MGRIHSPAFPFICRTIIHVVMIQHNGGFEQAIRQTHHRRLILSVHTSKRGVVACGETNGTNIMGFTKSISQTSRRGSFRVCDHTPRTTRPNAASSLSPKEYTDPSAM
jgi:hypothetical protein